MEKIHSKAISVIVWLGPESESSRATMDLIVQCNRSGGVQLLDHKEDAQRGTSIIFLRGWWKRIWIVQEVVAARDLVTYRGHRRLLWHFVAKVCHENRRNEFSRDGKPQHLRSSGYRNFTALNDFRRGRMSLTKCLQCTKDYEGADMWDKLYALIGVAPEFWTTIVAGKNYMAAESWVKERFTTDESEALEHASRSFVAGNLPPEM